LINHVLVLKPEGETTMTSDSKKIKAIRTWKDRPHKANLKASMKRIKRNTEILRELAEKDRA
jgi:hypothetical protein